MTLYQILCINPSATAEEIKSAYRRQAMKWHPDRTTENKDEAEKRFKDIGYAYSILSDPKKRVQYDETLNRQTHEDDHAEFSSEKAFSIFIAAILDMAFEMATQGKDAISIYQTLVAEGCPEAIAKTIAQRAYAMASKAGRADESQKHSSRPHREETPPPNSPSHKPTHKDDRQDNVSPGRRWWARLFDITFAGIFILPVWFFLIAKHLSNSQLGIIASLFILIGLTFAFLGLIGGIFGNTPGKHILNIAVRKENNKLDIPEYISREFIVLLKGHWLGLPLISLIPQFLAYREVKATNKTSWDNDRGYDVIYIGNGKARYVTYVISFFAIAMAVSIVERAIVNSSEQRPNFDIQSTKQTPSGLEPQSAPNNSYKSKQGYATANFRIGLAGPMSGPQQHLGLDIERGARLAIDELNNQRMMINGQVAHFDLIVADDQSDSTLALVAAKKLIDSKISVVIGHMNSGTSIPASKLYSDAGVVQISPSSTNPKLTKLGFSTAFRLIANDEQQARGLAEYVSKRGFKKIAVIDDQTAYGLTITNEFVNKVISLGIDIVARKSVNASSTEFSDVLSILLAVSPDLIFFGGMDNQAGLLARQVRQKGIRTPILGGDGICTPETGRIAGSASANIFCSMPIEPINVINRATNFKTKFNARFGEIQLYAPNAYDAVMVAARAIQRAGNSDREKIAEALNNMEFVGILQNYRFANNGDLLYAPVSIFQVKNQNLEYKETIMAP